MKEMASMKQIAYLEYLRGKAGEPLDGLELLTKRQASGEIDRHLGKEPKPAPTGPRKRKGKRKGGRPVSMGEAARSAVATQQERKAALSRHVLRTKGQTASMADQREREQRRAEDQQRIAEREQARAGDRRKRDLPTDGQLHDIMVLARRVGVEHRPVYSRAEASQELRRLRQLQGT